MSNKRYEEVPLEHLSKEQLQEVSDYIGKPMTGENLMNIQNKFDEKRSPKTISIFRNMKKRYRIAVLAAAFLILIPTTVFGASKIWEMMMTKDQYEATLSVKSVHKANDEKFYKLDLNYLPSNMSEMQAGSLKYSYKDNENNGGFSFLLWKLNGESEFSILNVKEYTKTTFGDHPGWFIQQIEDYGNYTRKAFIAFEDEGYMLEVYVANDVTNEVMEKVFNNLTLKEVSKDLASSFSDYNKSKNELESVTTTEVLPLPLDSKQIFKIGDTASIKFPFGDSTQDVDFSIDSVEILDSIPDLEFVPSRLEILTENNLIDADGNFLEYEGTTYQPGDGKTTITKVINQETMKVKFVYLTATIENKSSSIWEDVYISPQLQVMKQTDNAWNYSSLETYTEPFGANSYELDYLDKHGDGKSYYKMDDMAPNEKRTISLGYFVPDTDLDSIFVDLFNYGHSVDKEDLNAKDRWWIDLRQDIVK